LYVASGQGRDAREVAEEVQRRALHGEARGPRPPRLAEHLPRGEVGPLRNRPRHLDARIQLRPGLLRTPGPGEPAGGPGRDAGLALTLGQQGGGEVAERRQVLRERPRHRLADDVHRGVQPLGTGSWRHHGVECCTGDRAPPTTRRCAWDGSVDGWSTRAWVPPVSVRASAAATSTRATSTRFRTSSTATSTPPSH